jgi:ATP-independent RNA helicase DbpA
LNNTLFSELNLPAAQLANLESLGYKKMTLIQAEAMPIAMDGSDLIAQAKTGSGKTAAFAIPLIHRLDMGDAGIQALILCPTRELSIQVTDEIRKLARYLGNVKVVTLYGGQIMALQKTALKTGAHILVGTPGRVKDHLARETLSLGSIRTLVLDEADRMLEMGFFNDITEIIGATHGSRQTLFFSATFPENIRDLSARFQRNPAHVSIEAAPGPSDIDQKFVRCDKDGKLEGVTSLLSHLQPASAIIFCNTKAATKEVHQYLLDEGFSAAALHGDMEQRDREQVLMRFRHLSCRVLVATDVAARGLDIEDLSMVINFEVPHDPETYVHRIGRTGRAGKSGSAFTLTGPTEQHRMQVILDSLGTGIPSVPLDSVAGKKYGVLSAEWVTLGISAGRKNKLRAGDILGALTGAGDTGLDGKSVGKIDVMDHETFVSVTRKSVKRAFAQLSENKIKGQKFRIRIFE